MTSLVFGLASQAQAKNYKQKAKRTVSFPNIGQPAVQNKSLNRTYMQRHTMTETVNHRRSTALERSVKYYLGWWARGCVCVCVWGGGGGGGGMGS